MILLSATLILLVLYIALMICYRAGWKSIQNFIPSNVQPSVFITVIIPARNEETALPVLLETIKNQDYPTSKFEVIVVDDHSTDRTQDVVNSFRMENLHLIRLQDHVEGRINSYKKKAIEIAINQSKGQLIVTTDADCTVPAGWLRLIAAFYETKNHSFIVMPVKLSYKNNLLEIFQAVDFMTLQGVTGAGLKMKLHNMCNGANLAYTKEAFNAVDGFKGIDSIASGDDMLLMQKIHDHAPERIGYLRSSEVTVLTPAMQTISSFLNQRIRWASKTGNYKDVKITMVLILVYMLNLMLLVLPLIAIFSNFTIFIYQYQLSLFSCWLAMLVIKIIFELFFLIPVSSFFKNEKLLFFFPLLQPFHIIYTVVAGWLGKMGRYQWKGRQVH